MYKPTVIRESISCIPLPIVKKAQDKLKVTLKNRCNIKFPEPNSSSRSSEFESASISGNNNINNHNNTSAITSNNNSNNTNNYNTPPHNSAYRGRCHTMSDISEFSANRSNASVKSLSCDFLNCSLCNQKYHKPKILPCLHTFCEKCLLTDIPAHSIAATCPLCDQPSILPPGGVTELQNNDFVTSLTADSTSCQHRTDNKMAVSCVQCCITMCELCARLHDPDHNICVPMSPDDTTPTGSPHHHSSSQDSAKTIQGNPLVCRSHNDSPLTLYCRYCETAVCSTCCQVGAHRDHEHIQLSEVIKEKRRSLENLVVTSKKKIPEMQDTVQKLKQIYGSLANNYKRSQKSADLTFLSLEQLLRERHKTVCGLLENAFQSKRDAVQYQIDELSSLIRNMNSCDEYTNTTLDKGNDTDILVLGKEVTEKFHIIKENLTTQPNVTDQFSFDNDDLLMIENQLALLGSVGLDKGLPLYTTVSGAAIKRCYCRRSCSIRVTVRDSLGQESRLRDIDDLQARITKAELNGEKKDILSEDKTLEGTNPSSLPCTPSDGFPLMELCRSPDTSASMTSITSPSPNLTSNSSHPLHTLDPAPSSSSKSRVKIGGEITSFERVNECSIDISYTLQSAGIHYMHILLYGQHIKDSPFKIDVYEDNGVRLRSRSTSRIPAQISSLLSPGSHANAAKSSVNRRQGSSGNISTSTPQGKRRALKRPSSYNSQKIRTFEFFSTGDDLYARIGEKGRNRGQFTNPQGVACGNVCQEAGAVPGEELGRSEIDDSYSTMYVTDSNNQCVQAFNIQTGELKMKFGARGRLPGQLLRPTGITVTQRNNVLVADYDNQCVNVYSAVDGKFKSKICGGKLLGPKGVCVDSKGRVIVVDNRSSSVVVFSTTGKFIFKFGSRGSGNPDSYLAGPHFCATTADDDIVVTDFHNHCVKVYTCDGVHKFSFGKNGEKDGEFNAPTGVAVDKHGNILVADWGNSRIQVFDSAGKFLSYISTSSDVLYGPQDIAVTSNGIVGVADSGNHCLKLYRYLS